MPVGCVYVFIVFNVHLRATQMLGTSREGRLCGSLNVLASLSFGRTLEYAPQYLSNEVLINKHPIMRKFISMKRIRNTARFLHNDGSLK